VKVTIGSPDKISLGMLGDFVGHCCGQKHVICNIHHLMTAENLSTYVDGFMETSPDVIFRYYANRHVKTASIPAKLIDVSDVVLWTPQFSVEVQVIKDTLNFMAPILPRWKANVERMSKITV